MSFIILETDVWVATTPTTTLCSVCGSEHQVNSLCETRTTTTTTSTATTPAAAAASAAELLYNIWRK